MKFNQIYVVELKAFNQYGSSDWSSILEYDYGTHKLSYLQTLKTIPIWTNELILEDITGLSFTVKWNKPNNGGSEIKYYELYLFSDNKFTLLEKITDINITNKLIIDLTPNSEYKIKILAVNDIGSSEIVSDL